MCGIAGCWDTRLSREDTLHEHVKRMVTTLRHRGPNDSGIWIEAGSGIGLGHTRLSIIDLTPEGHQPMLSRSGRYTLVYNGEIYNFKSLRHTLQNKGVVFRGHSDTEVILAMIEEQGLEESLKQLVGMFAFALWDSKERSLYLVRDRIGEKPLYYGWAGGAFLFASELKAICSHPDFKKEINRDILPLYLRLSSMPAPYSIYRNIFKLPPASFSKIQKSSANDYLVPKLYWPLAQIAEQNASKVSGKSEAEWLEELDALFRGIIRGQMISDVPLGAFLSGGLDSSTVVSLMQAENQSAKTFTIGFRDSNYDEAPHARAVAAHLKTDHTEFYVDWDEALSVIPQIPKIYDEPFADASQIPTFLLCRLARNHVTVALSGDGGDELFGGYSRYLWSEKLWRKMKHMPENLRPILSSGVSGGLWMWEKIFPLVATMNPNQKFLGKVKDRMLKLSDCLRKSSMEEIYFRLISHWPHPKDILLNAHEPQNMMTDKSLWPHLPEGMKRIMFFGVSSFLPDIMLTKVDRASMAVGLEVRAPFLDHRLVEFAWQIPDRMNFKEGKGKWILRNLLKKYLPESLIKRSKMGFEAPLDFWLRGSLRDWAEHLLDEKRLAQEGFFNVQTIRNVWKQHLSGVWDAQYYLWDILMFQSWQDEWIK